MAQLFHRSFNVISRASLVGVVLLVIVGCVVAGVIYRASWKTDRQVAINQPVPFSHQHHVGVLGIDCRYCHTSVEDSSFAGIPSTHTCMTCHSQIWTNAPLLAPVRRSYATGEPVIWNRVHDLPDFVYFNHSIHVQKGVACVECHGRVDLMPITWQAKSLHMEWCLDCHERPHERLRPNALVVKSDPPLPSEKERLALARAYDIHAAQLTDCSICHR